VQTALQPPGPSGPRTVSITSDPLALDLYYLLIPFSTANNFMDTYEILGMAMSSFHNHAVFSPAAVGVAGLFPEERDLEFRISMNPLSTSDLLRVWEAVHRPYRLSVAYVVRTVQIDSAPSRTVPLVSERQVTGRPR